MEAGEVVVAVVCCAEDVGVVVVDMDVLVAEEAEADDEAAKLLLMSTASRFWRFGTPRCLLSLSSPDATPAARMKRHSRKKCIDATIFTDQDVSRSFRVLFVFEIKNPYPVTSWRLQGMESSTVGVVCLSDGGLTCLVNL